jgi:hypothetical protein
MNFTEVKSKAWGNSCYEPIALGRSRGLEKRTLGGPRRPQGGPKSSP